MPRIVSSEALVSFVEEIREYLPVMRHGVESFYCDAAQKPAMHESFRLAHSTKGTASMVGLPALAHVSYYAETLFEALHEGSALMDDNVLQGALGLLDCLERLLDNVLCDSFDERAVLVEATLLNRRVRGLPEADDEQAIKAMLHEVSPVVVCDAASASATEAHEGEAPAEPSADAATQSADISETQSEISNFKSEIDAPTDDDDQLEAFRVEADDHLVEVARLLSEFRRDISRLDDLNEVRRRIHSLKGAASTIGLHAVAHLSHRVEDILQQLLNGSLSVDESTIDLMQSATDVLEELVDGRDVDLDLQSQLTQRLDQLVPADAFQPPALASVQKKPVADIDLDDRSRVSEDLLEIFTEEAEDHLRSVYGAFGRLEKDPENRDFIQDVRRAAHTLKGAAGAVGLKVVTQLSHRMEDVLDKLYERTCEVTPEILTLLYSTTDVLQDLVNGQYEPEATKATISDLYEQYQCLLATPAARLAASAASVATTRTPSATAGNVLEVADAEAIGKPAQFTPQATEDEPSSSGKSADSGKTGQVLRVPIERLDTLVRMVSELIINRTAFEQRMSDFVHVVDEMQLTIERLRHVSQEMDSRYGVTALGGRGLRNAKGEGASLSGPGFHIPKSRHDDEFDALEFDRYTEFHLLSRSLAEGTNDINTVGGELRNLIGDFDALLTRQGRLSRDAQDRLMRIRMVPLATLSTRLHRTVRVVGNQQGKQIDLDIVGEHVELDKVVLEEMADPLLHLLRNAADHGVEPPALRLVKGKGERATIRVKAFYQGTQVVIQVSDDGNGIDADAIRAQAVENGFCSQADAEQMSEQELFQFIFVAGFSTAKEVSEVSGRGVGMDIVRSKVHALKGTVEVESHAGVGTTFTVRLPMTLAMTRALLVHAANETFAIPMQAVVQILRLERSAIDKLGSEPMVKIGGKAHPLVKLAERLRLKGQSDESAASVPVLILEVGGQQIALGVDKILSGRDIVVKTLGTHLRNVKGLIGATLMGDGTVVPILDPAELIGHGAGSAEPRHRTAAPKPRFKISNDIPTIMIVDDSVSVRRVMSNLVKNAGWLPVDAKDGIDALEKLQHATVKPDLFLLDIEMPRMDGYELLASLRSQDAFRDTPIVMVTSRAAEKHRKKALDLGASDYLIKPYQDDVLLGLVRELLAGKREAVMV